MERRPRPLLIRKQKWNNALEIPNDANMILKKTKLKLPKVTSYTEILNLKRGERDMKNNPQSAYYIKQDSYIRKVPREKHIQGYGRRWIHITSTGTYPYKLYNLNTAFDMELIGYTNFVKINK